MSDQPRLADFQEESGQQQDARPMEEEEEEVRLYKAVRDDDCARLRELLLAGANPDTFFEDEMNISSKSLLHICCEKGRLGCAEALAEAGASLMVRDKWGQTPLMYSVLTQYPEMTDLLLGRDPTIADSQDSFGKAALHSVSDTGCARSARALLRSGADVNIRTMDGMTPLMTACCSRHIAREDVRARLLRIFLDAGAMIELKDYRSKRTVLQMAVLTKNIEIVEMLLQHGADPNTLDGTGRTPLTNCMMEHVKLRDRQAKYDDTLVTLVVMLTQAGTNLDRNVCEYSNPVVTAALLGANELLEYFLEEGATADLVFPSGVTPLLVAVSKKHVDVVRSLLYWNCNMYTKGYICKRRLEYIYDSFELAVHEGHFQIVDLLLHCGYKPRPPYMWQQDASSLPTTMNPNPDLFKRLNAYLSVPQSLFSLTVFHIRNIIGTKLKDRVDQLPLPQWLKTAVLLQDLLK